MRLLALLQPGIAPALLLCLTTSCAHTVEVPTPIPLPACPAPEWVPPPVLTSRSCGDDVCIPWREARDLATWIGQAARWHELAQVCLDTREPSRPTPFIEAKQDHSFFHLTDIPHVVMAHNVGVEEIVAGMTMRGMAPTKVIWKACGQPNGYYTPADNTITMCYELLDFGPGVTRFVAAHEMGHSVINQLRIPYTGLQEMAADELAAVVLHLTDHFQDVVDASTFFHDLGRTEDPLDPHPSDMRRFVLLWLLANETNYFDHALYTWACLLAPYRL